MEICVLGSSSSGNATAIWTEKTKVLIDCGFSAKEIENRMNGIDLEPEKLDGIIISHEHSDHTKGAEVLSRRYEIPVYANKTTFLIARNLQKVFKKEKFSSHSDFNVGDLTVTPLVVPHDASEPNAFIFRSNGKKVTLATDLGTPTPIFFKDAENSDLFIFESNYDKSMLLTGHYPPFLKKRILSDFGHMSNTSSARTLRQLVGPATKYVLLAHISQNNNTPDLALENANSHLRGFKDVKIELTYPDKCSKIIRI